MNKLTGHDIDAVAALARLDMGDEEKQMYAEQLSVVFEYIEQLNEVPTDGVEETSQVTGLTDIVREDIAKACDEKTKNKLIEAFPERIGKLLKVKAVFE